MIRLLHLDSDKKFLEKTRRYLDKQGNFSLCPVTSSQDAPAILKTRKVDVIVSGQSEGIELLKALKSEDTAVPVIIFSVPAGEEQVIEALNLGADYFLLSGDEFGPVFDQQQQIIGKVVTRSNTDQKMLNSYKIPDQNPDPVMRVSKEGFLTYANPAAYLLLEEWGITVESMVDPVKGTFEKALSNGIPLRTGMEAEGSVFQFTFEPEGNKEYVTIYGHH
jgi:DNA-binding NarL/FixJ family response regulator